jgi:hypothetical protein
MPFLNSTLVRYMCKVFARTERRITMIHWTRILGAAVVATVGVGSADARSPVVKEPAPCGDHGTSIYMENTPAAAAKKAIKEEKLVMILHVSGQFEDPALT